MQLKKIITIIFIVFFSLNLHSQRLTLLDSIKLTVQKEPDYNKKINLLQENIKKIYTTKFDESIQLAHFGLKLANKNNDKINKGDFLRTIGLSLGKKGNIDSASVYYHKALKELEQSNDNKKLGLLYDDMARMYRKLQQSDRALYFYDKALTLYQNDSNLEGIARINNESGAVFNAEGNYTEANKRFLKSLQIQQQRNDSLGIGYSLEFLGNNQLLIKNYKKAESYLQQALKVRQKGKDEFALMLNYTALGEYYKEVKKHKLSNNYFEKSNTIAKKIKFPDIQRYNYQQMMKNYEDVNNYKKAFNNLKAFNILNDSLYNIEKLKNIEEITTKYETVEKENQILQQKAEIAKNKLHLKNRNLWIFGLTTLAVIISVIGFLLYKQQVLKNIKQQRENELKLAIEKIEHQNKLQEQKLSISRDLHDNIGAQLSFVVAAINTIKYYLSDKDEKLTSKLDTIKNFAKETTQELRDTVWAMNKSDISIKDLHSRIANFIEKAKQSQNKTNITVNVDENFPEDVTFTSLQGLNAFRIIQEATNNALKYAKASQITIHIYIKEDNICFSVKDNGKGFIEKNVELGNGLLNMRKRSIELKSQLNIQTELEKGVEVSFCFIIPKTTIHKV
ncbi:sensor histidine kinase [uncultured Tenacibaculum sp.]|uniref:tetratricopeptide repeat-containing sensor histidine kinase n=1 Tax=uncultured Tenacibaculum sp. TaxID=174713 RepID=UPI0026215344|nr:sensor histidine kinase [uncultured Tenacibaculum sp.]